MKAVIASNNAHKIREIKEILSGKFETLLSLEEAGICCDPEENGATFLENALIKAKEIAKYTALPVIADDTGLCVNALGGAPGIRSARYASDHDFAANRRKLLQQLQGKTDRSAYFATAVVLLENGKVVSAEGRVDGTILQKETGEQGFGYDSLFFCTELNKSFGECTDEEKNSVSHRARALKALLEKL